MAHVVLFHSTLGLRPGVRYFADQLRAAGHIVVTPDLYDGEILDNYQDGGKKFASAGIPARLQQAQTACKDLPEKLVYAGFSNGAALAEFLAASRPHAQGAILMHGALPPAMLQLSVWPKGVPVQLHYNDQDPWRKPKNDMLLQQAVEIGGAQFEEFLYDGDTHLFADSDMPDYVEVSAKLMLKRVLTFLDHVDHHEA